MLVVLCLFSIIIVAPSQCCEITAYDQGHSLEAVSIFNKSYHETDISITESIAFSIRFEIAI